MLTRHVRTALPRNICITALTSSKFPIHLTQHFFPTTANSSSPKMAPSKQNKDQAVSKGHKSEDVEGEDNEWKFCAPYKVHDPSEGFKAVHEGSCHCGRVQYQLSRERPLDAKFCHCNTCQVLHGKLLFPYPSSLLDGDDVLEVVVGA